ncbi:hypothetical protein M427DRAFT_57356 [Gonapodya prolifera JEL478]|uniref:Exostosin GT47 domain-containing protein n=1 Tax=Gonapodya prolifera (strain JEL478) TaxID=1344416 RepID=A0A139AD45_GONPJ|nr:hypothetical protein M427DRAFT_57356 [Gonapodya prolifera JEL478]|eukprot:KXS14697.1 hypothetical protein M427DRAFT_57356 [Gonapodya prolifera JEL478]
MYSVEVLFPKLVLSSRHHSQAPSNATYFLVPHYTTRMYHHCIFSLNLTPGECKSRASSYFTAILNHIQTSHPFWNRSGGFDRILLFHGIKHPKWWDRPPPSVTVTHLTLLGTTTTPHPNFSPQKDLVIPPFANFTLPLLATHRPPSQRHVLTHFRGGMQQNETCSLRTPLHHLDSAQRYHGASAAEEEVTTVFWAAKRGLRCICILWRHIM